MLAVGLTGAPAAAFTRVGIVLLHGKAASPAQFADVANTLSESGYGVETPEMCWSARRIYDKPLDQCFADIDAAVAKLRAEGFAAIVVGGASLGGLVALAYAAGHDGLAGVIALAPAGRPADFSRHLKIAASVKRATAMVATGHGDDTVNFTDRALGRYFTVKATPRAFLSFLGPDSRLDPARLVSDIHAPLFWAAGSKDFSQRNAASLFRKAPANDLNRFVTVKADHVGTPAAALTPLVGWLGRISGK